MKVFELIDYLKTVDGNLNVYVHGYEGGVSDCTLPDKIVQVALNVNSEWYYGEHEVIYPHEAKKYSSYKKDLGILFEN